MNGYAMINNIDPDRKRTLMPLTPRQQELIRILQGFTPDRRYALRIVCRGREPWEIEEVIESRRSRDDKPDG